MSIHSIAIVGKNNKPLYLQEFNHDDNDAIDEEVLFGLTTASITNKERDCSLRQQFILHAALDRFDELAGPPPSVGWRQPGVTGSDAMWVGLLCPVEELRVYGYMTTTKIKFMVVVQDDVLPDQPQFQREKDDLLKSFLKNVHDLYVEYTLNPFNALGEKIESKKFHQGLQDVVLEFNSNNGGLL